MVAIYGISDNLKAEDFRAFLIACGISCKLVCMPFTDVKTASLVNIIENGSDIPSGADPESILFSNFDKEEYSSEKLRLYYRILDVLDVKYGINPEFVLTELYCDMGNDVRFCGVSLKLSHTQRMLMKYLAVNEDRWCSAEELAAFCMTNVGTNHHIAVQMDAIRKHVADMAEKLIFETKRGSGYKLLHTVKRL